MGSCKNILNYLCFTVLGASLHGVLATTTSTYPLLIIVSSDGFRYDYLDLFETKHLHKVKSRGVSVPYMRNQFTSRSFPNHQSLATGLFIESHGIVGSTFYDEDLGYLNGRKNDSGFWNYSSEIIPLWTENELAGEGRYSGVMMWPGGSEAWGPEKTYATYRRDYKIGGTTKEAVDEVLSWISNDEKPANLVMMYLSEPDYGGHHYYGSSSPQLAEQVEHVDSMLGYLVEGLEELGIRDRVNLIFAGDHGMSEVLPGNMIPHYGFIDNANESLYRLAQGSPVMQILPRDKSDTLRIFDAFANQTGNYNFTVYLTSELAEKEPQWHFAAPRRTAPIVVIADPGYVFQDYWGIATGRVTGIHGYDPAVEKNMYPYFMAAGPFFKENATAEPFDNVDVYPLACLLLGLTPRPNNGSLHNVLPLVREVK